MAGTRSWSVYKHYHFGSIGKLVAFAPILPINLDLLIGWLWAKVAKRPYYPRPPPPPSLLMRVFYCLFCHRWININQKGPKGMDPDMIEALYRSIDRLTEKIDLLMDLISDVYR